MPHTREQQARTALNRIIVLRALPGLGDFLCVVPALRTIRAAHPGTEVHLVGLESTRALVDRFPQYVDAFHAFPGHEALPELPPPTAIAWQGFIDEMRELRAGLALQLHGSGETTNHIAASVGATRMAGFVRPGDAPPPGSIPVHWDDAEPEPSRWLRLLEMVGIPAAGHHLELPLPADAATRARHLRRLAAGAEWAVIHPGAARPHGRWSVEGFRDVARRLAASGLRVVVTGTSDETALAAEVAAAAADSVDLAGRTDLDALGGLIAGARLLVANDTGAAHLASALGTPSVVVFATGDAAYFNRWAALDRTRHLSLPPYPTTEAVLDAVDRQLGVAAAVA